MRCDQCSTRACLTGEFGGNRPKFCPFERKPEAFEKARKIYEELIL